MPYRATKQSGYLLLEILVTIGILAVGLLGLGAMQLTALKSSYSAVQRGEAAIMIAAMSDRMRANPGAFWNKAAVDDIEYNSLPPGSRARKDQDEWHAEIDATFGVKGDGTSLAAGSVNCITKVNCILQIQWNDPRADAALNPAGEAHTTGDTYRYKHIVSVIF